MHSNARGDIWMYVRGLDVMESWVDEYGYGDNLD